MIKINTKRKYKLTKEESNNARSGMNIEEGVVMDRCTVTFHDNGCLYASLDYHSDLAPYEWFRTSLVKSVVKIPKGYIIKTLNSVYKLTEI